MASDLLRLADLLDHEPNREAVVALWARCYDGLLDTKPYGPALREAVSRFCDSLTEIPTCYDANAGDALLADFQSICVTDANHHERHLSMTYGLEAQHLHSDSAVPGQWASLHGISFGSGVLADRYGVAVKLRYLAYLVAADGVAAPVEKLQLYLERYLLRNVEGLAAEVSAHSGTHFYRELGILIAAYVHELGRRFADGQLDAQRSSDRSDGLAPQSALSRRGGLRSPHNATGVLYDR
jgi:TorA maturation chaperone TorD